jgi:DNA repair protein RadA/Sms
MTDKGLDEVPNPSEMLLSGRPKNISGNCALCTMEGTRPILAEIQALVTPTVFPAPRRNGNGVDYNRVCLILAVLEKRLGLKFYQNDVYLNVVGGLSIDEPAADLAIATALISSLTDKIIPDDLIIIGELGLAGECRAVSNPELRVREAARLGFTKAIIPYKNTEKRPIKVDGMKIIPVRGIYEVINHLKSID